VRELTEVIRDYGEERFAQSAAGAIAAARAVAPIVSTAQLAAIVGKASALGRGVIGVRIRQRDVPGPSDCCEPELAEGVDGIAAHCALLAPGGRLAVISFHSLEDRIVKRFFAWASAPWGGDPRLARLSISTASLPRRRCRAIGARASRRGGDRAQSACAQRGAARGRAHRRAAAADWPQRRRRARDARELVLLARCRLRAVARDVAPRRAAAVRRARARAGAGAAVRDRVRTSCQLEQSTWGMPARVEKIARETLRMQLPAAARVEVVDSREGSARERPRDAARATPRRSTLPRFRARALFGALGLLFVVLLGRSLYLQWSTTTSCRRRARRASRAQMELPAHRGRIVDRFGDALAISTPVKSLWTFPDQFDATPAELAALARVLETTPQKLAARVKADEDFAFLARQIPPETAERAMALRIKGSTSRTSTGGTIRAAR
jgi:hypothetical protein